MAIHHLFAVLDGIDHVDHHPTHPQTVMLALLGRRWICGWPNCKAGQQGNFEVGAFLGPAERQSLAG